MMFREMVLVGVACALSSAGTVALVRESNLDAVRTERLEVVNSKGEVRGVVTCTDEGDPMVALTDGKGKPRYAVLVDAKTGTPSIALMGSGDEPVLAIAVNEDNSAAFNFQDKAGAVRGTLVIDETGNFEVARFDKDGKKIKGE